MISQLKNCGDEEKEKRISSFMDHIQKAKSQRAYYKKFCTETNEDADVRSFDFAQNVNYPVSPQQPGSAYFKAGRKCSVFGITNELLKKQVPFHSLLNFLIPSQNVTLTILNFFFLFSFST